MKHLSDRGRLASNEREAKKLPGSDSERSARLSECCRRDINDPMLGLPNRTDAESMDAAFYEMKEEGSLTLPLL